MGTPFGKKAGSALAEPAFPRVTSTQCVPASVLRSRYWTDPTTIPTLIAVMTPSKASTWSESVNPPSEQFILSAPPPKSLTTA